MITACGYTSKFNQATLGTSSRGAVAAAASACWGPWGSSQAAGLNPKSLLVWLHGPWHTWKPDWNQLGGVCTSCSHSEARGEEDQAPCSLHPHHTGDMRGQQGSCPGHPVRRPALLRLWNTAHIHLLQLGWMSWGWEQLSANRGPALSSQTPGTRTQKVRPALKPRRFQRRELCWVSLFGSNRVRDFKLFLSKHRGWENTLERTTCSD